MDEKDKTPPAEKPAVPAEKPRTLDVRSCPVCSRPVVSDACRHCGFELT